MPKIQKREPKNKYEEYCWKNATEFLKLVIDFLSNENEGAYSSREKSVKS